MNRVEIFAPAKINLVFHIKGLREDGYHEVETIMQSLTLKDRIIISEIEAGIRVQGSNPALPGNADNLAYQAAELVKSRFENIGGISIYIEKNIPIAAGMAGGSSDAAAVLKGMDILFNLDMSQDLKEEMAAVIGADVPFCLQGGTVLATGRGDRLTPLPDIKRHYIVLIKPPLAVSTVNIFKKYDKHGIRMMIPELTPADMADILYKKKRIIPELDWFNDLQPVTASFIDDIDQIIALLYKYEVQVAMMTGSGPTVFAITEDAEQARYIKGKWPREQDLVICTRTGERAKEFTGRKYKIDGRNGYEGRGFDSGRS